jgi:hypothetical protein
MKKVLVMLLLVFLVLPAAVHAGPPVNVVGDFIYTPVPGSARWAGNNLFLEATDTADWTGDFEGESFEEYVVVLHGASGVFGTSDFTFEKANYKGTVTFTGWVQGEKEGSLEILFVGKSPGDLAVWTGTWRILSGTGDLANLRGSGVFWNNALMDVHYEGRIHFDPK